MELKIDDTVVYSSSFDEKTGNVVRAVEDFGDRWNNPLYEKARSRFPHRWGKVASPSPELCDIAITNRCDFGCSFCYQDSKGRNPHGRRDLVEKILGGFTTVPYQIAIGGGEPTMHPDFPYILRKAREMGTVPNYTTAGHHMTDEIVEATNEVCGGVAMTYHSFRGFDWFKEHYLALRKQLKVKLNIHLIADKNVAKNLKTLVANRDELGPLSIVLLAYYPDVGRASLDGMMTRTVYMKHLPEEITIARNCAVDISFSEGLLPYFMSRPKLGVNTQFAMPSEGLFSCYFDHTGRISESSFDGPDRREKHTVFNRASQKLWDGLSTRHSEPSGEACYGCPQRSRCSVLHDYFYYICDYASHNSLPLDTKEEPVIRRSLFERLDEED